MKVTGKEQQIMLLSNEEFFKNQGELKKLCKLIKTYKCDYDTWRCGPNHRMNSKILLRTKEINNKLLTISSDLKKCLDIEIDTGEMIAEEDSVEDRKRQYRKSLITNTIQDLLLLKNNIPEVNSRLYNINRHRIVHMECKPEPVFQLKNRKTWLDAFYQVDMDSDLTKGIISPLQLTYVGKYVQDCGHVTVIDALTYAGVNVPDAPTIRWIKQRANYIIEHLPILYLNNKNQHVFANAHGLQTLGGLNVFSNMLDTPSNLSVIPEENEIEFTENELLYSTVSHKPGRKLLYKRFPGLVPVLLDFIEQHGYSAQAKRRNEIGTVGCTLSEMLSHARSVIPDFTGTRESIRRLMFPRREGKKFVTFSLSETQ